MTDARLVQRGSPFEAVTLDLLLTPMHDLDTSQELATAVTVALLTDALAAEDDVLPDSRSTDRRGCWMDLDAQEIWNGWPLGSKIWLLGRTKITDAKARAGSTTAVVKSYMHAAIQPMIDRKIASSFEVSAQRVGNDRIDASVVLYRGNEKILDKRYDDIWRNIVMAAPIFRD